ncbi:plasmolipin-like isoform X2 [Paramacrobiotus metropolitanus]|nr:plasmolipin-like isoform X2 [Paramacrobiotus metropolitanus]
MNPSQPYPNAPYPSQTYAQQAYPASAGGATTTTVTTTRVVAVQPYFDHSYVRSIPGILKLVQLLLMLIAFILAAAAWSSDWRYFLHYCIGSAGWAKFVTITGFIITLILLCLYLFHLIERLYQVNWLFVELIYCGIVAILLFIAGAVMIPYAEVDGTRGACTFFCWLAMLAYGADAFFKFKSWRNGETAQG